MSSCTRAAPHCSRMLEEVPAQCGGQADEDRLGEDS